MKAFFLSRLLREKVLLLGLTAIAAVMWLSATSKRVRLFWVEARGTSAELADQKQWLGQRQRIENDMNAAVARLDPSRTFDVARLQSELDSIAHSVGINKDFAADDSKTTASGQLSVSTVRFVIRNTSWPLIKGFYQELAKRAPYIGIEEFMVSSNRANGQLTASLRVSSVEITR